jgi:hypothetical protein
VLRVRRTVGAGAIAATHAPAVYIADTTGGDGMAEPSPDKIVVGAIGPLITTVVGAAIGWLPGGLTGAIGQSLTNLLTAAGALSGLAFSLMYKRYIGVLEAGAEPKGSPERKAYDALRRSLRGGNIAARRYADWLTKFLNAVDRFFGDAGKADQTLFPRAFGLKTRAPLWTAPAFDRCLFLALVYPLATISIIWAVSGHVGPAEAALGLQPDMAGWRRGIAVGAIVILALVIRRAAAFGLVVASVVVFVVAIVALAFAVINVFIVVAIVVATVVAFVDARAIAFIDPRAGARAGAVAGAFVDARAIAFIDPRAGARAGAVAGALARALSGVSGVFAVAIAFVASNSVPAGLEATRHIWGVLVSSFVSFGSLHDAIVFARSLVSVVSFGDLIVGPLNFLALAVWIVMVAYRRRELSLFILFSVQMLLSCLVAAGALSPLQTWHTTGPMLMFLVLLTVINAPFDWFSLGLTRALLRRGLELGGWWPYVLALADALAAAFIIALSPSRW